MSIPMSALVKSSMKNEIGRHFNRQSWLSRVIKSIFPLFDLSRPVVHFDENFEKPTGPY